MPVYGNARPQFTDINGNPIQGGKLYIGMPDQDPVANPLVPGITDLSGVAIANPITLNDVGTASVAFKVVGDFSQAVYDADNNEITQYQVARTGGFLQASDFISISGQGGTWNSSSTYGKDDFVRGSDGKYYKSLTGSNLGNDPVSTSTSWSRLAWPTIYNSSETYDIDDGAIGSDGLTYLSLVNGNNNNDPTTDTAGNWTASSARTENLLYGNFRINQREVTGSVVLAAGEYGHDRFRGGAGGCTYTFATSLNITTATISAGTLEQEIEGLNILSGSHVLGWGGTAQGRIDGGSYGTSGVNATLTGGTNAIIEFDTGTVSSPRFREGGSDTGADTRPIGEEEELCKRYYETGERVRSAVLGILSATGAQESIPYTVEKRGIPTVAKVSTSLLLNITDPNININSDGSKDHLMVTALISVIDTHTRYGIIWTADAEL